MIDWEARYRELEVQIEHMLLRVADVMEHRQDDPGSTPRVSDRLGIREVLLDNQVRPRLLTIVADAADPEFALYLYLADGSIDKLSYQRNNTFHLKDRNIEAVRIKAFVRQRSNKSRMDSKHVRLGS